MLETKSEVVLPPTLPEFSFYPHGEFTPPSDELALLSGLPVGLANKIMRYRHHPFKEGYRDDLHEFDPARIRHLYSATDEQLLKVSGMGQDGIKQVRLAILEFHQKYFELPV